MRKRSATALRPFAKWRVRWNARIVTPKKHTESQHGTDLAIWVEIDLAEDRRGPAYRARKAVLVQAKRADKLSGELATLREQAQKMKAVSESAAVFVVGEDEMWAADADDLDVDGDAADLARAGRPIPAFFSALFRCQVGDHSWSSAMEVKQELEATTYLLVDGYQRQRSRNRRAFARDR